jgi:hypothetical protein
MLLSSLLVAGLCAGPLVAQPVPQAEKENTDAKALAQKAQFLKQQFEEFLANMLEVAELLEETEPETAKILRQTVEHAQRELVAEKMEAVRQALREGLDQAAEKSQGEVVTQLGQMLRILEGGVVEKSETDKKLQERQAALQEVNRLLEQERKEEAKTRAAAHAEELDKQTRELMEALKALAQQQEALAEKTAELPADDEALRKLGALRNQLDELIDRQEKMNDQTAGAPLGKLPVLSEAQKKLAQASQALGEAVAEASRDEKLAQAISDAGGKPDVLADAEENVAAAGKEMTRAAEALGRSHKGDADLPQKQASADLKAARRAIDEAMGKLAAETPTGEIAGEQDELAAEARALDEKAKAIAEQAAIDPESLAKGKPVGDLNKAAGHMNAASRKVESQEPQAAGDEQAKALAELRKKMEQAAELRERAMEKARQELDAEKQEQIAQDTNNLAERMKEGTDGKAMGGQRSVAQAGKSAAGAAGKMADGQAGPANADQNDAIEKLKQAQQQLGEEIAELQERSKQEKLAKVEEKLEVILEKQKAITAATKNTWENRRSGESPYDREAEQTLLDGARKEGQLSEDVGIVRKMLVDEGSTVIFPEILGDVKDDLKTLQGRLAEKDPGLVTQVTQQEVERTLQELINAVRKELSKGPGRGRGGGGGGGGQQAPLIPPVAELRMLLLKQQRVLAQTRKLEAGVKANEVTGESVAAESKVLSREQKRIKKLAEEINKKMAASGSG